MDESKVKQFNFTVDTGVCVMILDSSLDKAFERFKLIFGDFLFSNVKYIEIC